LLVKQEIGSQTVDVKLLGQRIALKSSGDPQLVREVAELVTARLKEAESRSKAGVPHHVALLALFSLAEEYVSAKHRLEEHRERMQRKSSDLIEFIESELK
jgi:cell division protein ZapA (FtsZ GTPase activity inhibitor)